MRTRTIKVLDREKSVLRDLYHADFQRSFSLSDFEPNTLLVRFWRKVFNK